MHVRDLAIGGTRSRASVFMARAACLTWRAPPIETCVGLAVVSHADADPKPCAGGVAPRLTALHALPAHSSMYLLSATHASLRPRANCRTLWCEADPSIGHACMRPCGSGISSRRAAATGCSVRVCQCVWARYSLVDSINFDRALVWSLGTNEIDQNESGGK
jgi:hypothetical protein